VYIKLNTREGDMDGMANNRVMFHELYGLPSTVTLIKTRFNAVWIHYQEMNT
jgi:hypothetical protein